MMSVLPSHTWLQDKDLDNPHKILNVFINFYLELIHE